MKNGDGNSGSNMTDKENGKWTDKQMQVIEYLSDPTDTRLQYETALELKIASETLTRWKKLPGFMAEVCDRLNARKDHVRPGIWKASYKYGTEKSVQDRRLLMEAVGDIRQKSDVSGDIKIQIDWGPDRPKDKIQHNDTSEKDES